MNSDYNDDVDYDDDEYNKCLISVGLGLLLRVTQHDFIKVATKMQRKEHFI